MQQIQDLEEKIAQQRLMGTAPAAAAPYTPPPNAVSGSGTDFQGEQVKDGRLTPEYQDALSTRFDQLGHGNPFAGTAGANAAEQQLAMRRVASPFGMNFSYTAPSGFSA